MRKHKERRTGLTRGERRRETWRKEGRFMRRNVVRGL